MARRLVSLVLAASVALLAGCTPAPGPAPVPGPGIDEIVAVDFRQSQAIENFDDAEYTQDDPAAIEELQALLAEHGIDPATWEGEDTGCAGNRVTQVTVRYAAAEGEDALAAQFSVDSCSDDPFELDADELFTGWREDLSG
jgi:pimeloyl-ACP methyl ester carboxylesterase